MRLTLSLVLLLIFMGTPCASLAVQPSEILNDAKLEARARLISEGLRCLVCQNQSIDDSDADLAHDLRVLVRQRLQAGDSDTQVKQFLVDRYGDYILLDPPFKISTYALWMGPPFLLGVGVVLAGFFYRRRRQESLALSETPFTPEEQQRLAALIDPHPTARGKAP